MEIIAHRGVHFNKNEENSLLAFNRAIEEGCQAIELDVRLTKDNELIVNHDAEIDFPGHGVIRIKNFTLTELVEMGVVATTAQPIGDFYPRLTLEVMLRIFALRCAQINIEFKDRGSAVAFLNLWLELEKQAGTFITFSYLKRINISSHHLKELVKIRQHFPDIEIGAVMGQFRLFWKKRTKIWDKLRKIRVTYADIHISNANKETTSFLREKGFKVRVYTVNNFESLLNCHQLGVDGIFTDNPRQIEYEIYTI